MCDDKMDSHNGMSSCGCGTHMGCHSRKHLICLLVMIVVGIIVFCTGVKIGELKAYYGGWEYGRGGYPMMNYQGYGMMRGWNTVAPVIVQETTSSKK